MKRLVLTASALALALTGMTGVGRASAALLTPAPATVASSTNDLLSLIPALAGTDVRHLCVIYDPLNIAYCLNIPLP